jgi:general secretion pathway protein E
MAVTLPYSFAKAQGILLEARDQSLICGIREGVTVAAMAEVARVAGAPVAFEPLAPDVFEARLAAAYRDNAADASDARRQHRDCG